MSQRALGWSIDKRCENQLFLVVNSKHSSVFIDLSKKKKSPCNIFNWGEKQLLYLNQLLNPLPIIPLLQSKLKAAVPSCLQTHQYGKHRVNTQLMELKASCVPRLWSQQVQKNGSCGEIKAGCLLGGSWGDRPSEIPLFLPTFPRMSRSVSQSLVCCLSVPPQHWEDDVRRFHRIFRHSTDTELVVLVGNHDIGFHYE